MLGLGVIGIVVLIIVILVLISCIRIVRQAQALVIERLGAYQATWGTGLHFKLPIFDRVARKVDLSLDVATDPWGIKVNRVELKNIIPPAAIQDAMEKQMKAERERREAILRAEGEKKSTILVAEGHKESAILDAEAEKQAAILRAEAKKEAMIREAEGEAEAIMKVQQANADGIRFLKDAGADQAVLTIKSLEAFEKAADGKATKIIIPSEIQGMAGLVKSLTEVGAKDDNPN